MKRTILFSMIVLLSVARAESEDSPFQLVPFEKEEPIFFEDTLPVVDEKLPFELEEAPAFLTELEEEKIQQETLVAKDVAKEAPASPELPVRVIERENREVAMAVPPLKSVTKVIESAMPVVNFAQVFAGSPIVYSLLLMLSVFALFVFLYNLLSIRGISDSFVRKLRQKLMSNQFEEALSLCMKSEQPLSRMMSSAISMRRHGFTQMTEAMKTEGKRATVGFWQKIALLNDIAVVAPMLGLLGTVLGMFYAFYDLNRSRESVSTLFDGLGISVGTTVGGLVVAIMAMLLHSFSKYRLMRLLTRAEDEAQALVVLLDTKQTTSHEKTT